ncbi:MAG: TonB-dependent receptor plug domain-containing protein, partial [Gammaproteobacteria bacterium]|nr:TonB-dependent receptor plug domain-containing protein [Gammaproteobacteria bacterium]
MRKVAIAAGQRCRTLVPICGILAIVLAGSPAYAQEEEDSDVPLEVDESMIEEIVVTGVRREIQDSIRLKRNSVTIVDGLNAEEIGALPALSIGEALETVTGAATHRENGGATEVAIRGLGPYLGNTVVNFRESTNGSGNRAVNFSIFPSELF